MMNSRCDASSDAQLVRQCLAGDDGAFAPLVERHMGVVYAIARARLGHREAAEDLAQEVFVRAHLSLRTLREPERFGAWLCRITRNLSVNWARRGQRRSQIVPLIPLDETLEATMRSPEPDPRQALAREQERAQVREAIDKLPAEQQEVVRLHFTEGLTMREIAQRLGMSPATVSRRVEQALRRLHGIMTPALRDAAADLRPRAALATRAAALVAAVAASGEVQAAVTAAGASTVSAGKAVGIVGSASSLLESLWALTLTGGKIMAMNKVAMVAAGVIAVGGMALYSNRGGESRSAAVPAQAGADTLDSHSSPSAEAPTERSAELRQIFDEAMGRSDFTRDPYAGVRAVLGAMNAGEGYRDIHWMLPDVVSDDVFDLLEARGGFDPAVAVQEFRAREILGVSVRRPIEEHSVAFVRYVDGATREIQVTVLLFEGGMWKFLLQRMSEEDLASTISEMGLEIANHRLVSFGGYAEGMRRQMSQMSDGGEQ